MKILFPFACLLTVQTLSAADHPRLIFSVEDLPALRERAKTPEGKVIIARCEKMLGERFTTWNAAGHAFLFQITGDKVHADRAREAAQAMMDGKGNPDSRYNYAKPNGQLRAGPVLGAMGLAYDMAYDGWDPEFRKTVAENIVGHKYAGEIVRKPRHHPGVNHWGAHSGGLGIALLALKDDPELGDKAKQVDEWLASITKNVKRELDEGFGPRGYYFEGHYCGRISANTGVIPFIQALRNVTGTDLTKEHDSAYWLAPKWIYDLTRTGNQIRNIQRGMYARDPFTRGDQLSADGDFSQGFGICPDDLKPALLWTYNNVVEPDPDKRTYDIHEYPHLAAFALANWPFDIEEKNPSELLPKTLHDEGPGYFVFRNGWTGTDEDIVVTALLGAKPDAGRGCAASGSVEILGNGVRYEFPGAFHKSTPVHVELDEKTGSGTITATTDPGRDVKKKGKEWAEHFAQGPTALAVDFSEKSGAKALVVMTGPQAGHVSFDCRGDTTWGGNKQGWHSMHSIADPKGKSPLSPNSLPGGGDGVENLKSPESISVHAVKAGDRVFYIAAVGGKNLASPEADGATVKIGATTISFDGKTLAIR